MDFIQLNKFSHLHDEKEIIFCKTDFLMQDFMTISKIKNNIILITGNSDHPIMDVHIQSLPKNVKKWFAQNALSNHEILEPIPIGLENKLESVRLGHGIGYLKSATEKEELLKRNLDIIPNKNIYSNFRVETNFQHRNLIKNLSIKSNFIEWEDPNLTLKNFFDKILEYKMVVCPAGNGVDTHRLWEVLYSNRVPITIKIGNFKIYQLYEKLPIIILDNPNELLDENLILDKYNQVFNKSLDLCDMNYWLRKIKNII